MDYFDDISDYEHEKESAKRVSTKIHEHDAIVGVIRGLITAINSRSKSIDPKEKTKIFLQGKLSDSLEIVEVDGDEYYSHSYNVLPDGQIVFVYNDKDVYSIVRYPIQLKYFKSMLPNLGYLYCYKQLKGLCSDMLEKASQFGVPPDEISFWQRKLSKLER